MKKIALIIIFIVLNTVNCFASNENTNRYIELNSPYIAEVQEDGTIKVKHQIIARMINNENVYKKDEYSIVFQQMPYQKDDTIMIPLKESINKEMAYRKMVIEKYSNMTEQEYNALIQNKFYEIENMQYHNDTAVFKKENNSASITFQENCIVVYDDKREIYANGTKIGLYTEPDITENDIFLSVQDFNMLFGYTSDKIEKEGKEIIWHFYPIYKDEIVLYDRFFIHEYEICRISTENNGSIFWNEKDKAIEVFKDRKDRLKDISNYYDIEDKSVMVYEKNNHMMIAIKDVEHFTKNTVNVKNIWNSQNNTVTLKLWYRIAKDIVFTKDSNKMIVNGVEVEMEEAAEIKKDRFCIPVTALFEILEIPEQDIMWIEKGKNVMVIC